jgi:predicted RND superfamily exporter protein
MSLSLAGLRILALSTLIAVVVTAIIGVPGLQLNSHYSAYFDNDDPLLVDHRKISALYSRKDTVFVVLQSSNSFLGMANYRLLEELTADLAGSRFANRVVSIPQLGILGETETEDGDYIPSMQQLREQGRSIGLLLADNARLAGILVQIELPDNTSKSVVAAFDAIQKTVQSAIVDQPVSAHYTGTLALNNAYIRVVQHDLGRILPLLFMVMVIVLAWMMRSWRSILAMLPIGICSVVGAFGVVGLFGAELAAINSFTPVIIFTISIAGCVHMALSFNHFRDKLMPAGNSALAAAQYNILPMALTNGTTALGFIGLAFSPSPPVRVMGYLVAVGVCISFILCMSLLPMLLTRIDPWKPVTRSDTDLLGQLARFVRLRRVWLILASLALALPATWLVSGNVITDDVFKYFSPSHPFSEDTRLVDRELSGVSEIVYSVDSGSESGFFSAEAVDSVERFSAWLRQQPEVNRVTSIADIDVLVEARKEGRLQQRLDFYRTRMDASAENPLLSLDVSGDFSSAAISAYLRPLNSNALVEFDRRALAWARNHLAGYSVKSGGPTLMFAHLGQQNIQGMLTALTVALVIAAIVLGSVFRSAHVAWIALVCNLLPLILAYSAWALFDGQISIGAAVVTGMILGIVLDDTIYLLATYRHAVKQKINDAVQYAMRRVGPALVVTTITLVSGLSLGLLSDFGPVWSMSVLSIIVIAVALLVDLLLLPALLLTVDASGDPS